MKFFVVFASCLALAAAGTMWDKFDRRDDDGYTRTRMGDTGMDDDLHFNKMGKFHDYRMDTKDSMESMENMRRMNRMKDMYRDTDIGMGIHTDDMDDRKRGIVDRVVHNVDKKFAKFDDDFKMKILGDKDLLFKQKFVLDVLIDVHKPIMGDDISRDVRIVDGEVNYKNFDKVIDFFRMLKDKDTLLPRGRVFAITNETHRRQLKLLFNLFFYSKDFTVLQRNVMWARKYINEEMFVHALIAAVLHRDDMVGVKLPALYEILPYKFHTSMTIDKALKLKDTFLDKKDLVIFNKYTKDYMTMNDEGKLAYLMEDIGWNLYHYSLHMDFGSWLGGKDLNLLRERRGEKYLFFMQQILSRYNLERLSHGMGNIKDFSIWDYVETGYNPMMVYKNGLPVTMRKNYYDVRETGDYFLIQRVLDFGRRIRDAIDKGYSTSLDGGKVDLKRWDGIDILGNLIQSNIDSVNNRYYGAFTRNMARLVGGGHVKKVDDFKLIPSVMDHTETALRDPVTYQLYKKVMKMVYMFKDNLPTYKKDDLILDGVRVDNIKTSKFITYFDMFDVDMRTMINIDDMKFKDLHDSDDRTGRTDKMVVARHMRLNHKPFSIDIDLTVDRPQKVVVRIFLGPKFDVDGKLFKLKNCRDNFFKLDKFTYDITQVGKVMITRKSRDFVYTVKDRTTIMDIYKQVLVNGDVTKLVDMHVDEANCGFPDRLVLPKGWVGGLPLKLFVIVTKAKDVVKRDRDHTLICGKRTLINEVDDNALGFPFDRRIDEGEFFTKNMMFKDVLIFHDDQTDRMMDMLDFTGRRMDDGLMTKKLNVLDSREIMDSRDKMDMMRMKMTMI